MATLPQAFETSCQVTGLDSSGSGTGPHDTASSTEEPVLCESAQSNNFTTRLPPRSNSAKTLSPPGKCATKVFHAPATECSLQAQGQVERTEPQLAPIQEVLQSRGKPQAALNQGNTGKTSLHEEVEQDVPNHSRPTSPSPKSGAGKPDVDTAKQEDARTAALQRLKLGTDVEWPDESRILSQIWRQQDRYRSTQLEWEIDKQEGLNLPGADKPIKDCVLTLEVGLEHTGGDSSNTDGIIGLKIISGPLQEVLRKVIAFDPTVNLYQDPILFELPFNVLFHYMPSLEEYARRSGPDDLGAKDLRVLLYICNKKFTRLFGSIQRCLAVGEVFDGALRALYCPGVLLLATDKFEQEHLFMCVSARWEYVSCASGRSREFIVRAWYMHWDQIFRRLKRRLAHFSLGEHTGTRRIKELPSYPLKYYGSEAAQQDLKAKLVERNRRWTHLVRQKASCWRHEGLALQGTGLNLINHSGRVVVEENQLVAAEWPFRDAIAMPDVHVQYWDNRPECLGYDKLGVDVELTDDQTLLCMSIIWCYDLKEQRSILVSLSNLKPADWNKSALKNLVLDQDRKDLMCAVIKNHCLDLPSQTHDIIKGKGSGLVIVLHGPPGVGKTLTAESVAEYTEKPLIALRITDLVTNESTFTNDVAERLKNADELGAIILLDEADVILESRSFEDVKRNGIVSAFLRTLEYFNGIIIMTTNRIETMDAAFQSRIQVAIEYKPLNIGSRRKIWGMFINKLESADAQEELLDEMDYLKKSSINGRQIRSVMKVSEALAKNDGREHMSVAHVKRAVEMASLQTYFENRKEVSRGNLRVSLQGSGPAPRKVEEEEEEAY